MFNPRQFLVVLGIAGILLFSFSPQPLAATFTVDSTFDASDASRGDGNCSTTRGGCTLRAAVEEANALAGDDEITLPSGTFSLRSGTLSITDDLTFTGNGADQSTIKNTTSDRAFSIGASVNVSMSNLEVVRGGFRVYGNLDFDNVSITGGDGIVCERCTFTASESSISHATSHALYVYSGTVSIFQSTFSDNTETSGMGAQGGALYVTSGTVDIVNSTIVNNKAVYQYNSGTEGAVGGGIYNQQGTISIANSTIANNSTVSRGGSAGADLLGGGIYNQTGTIEIKNSILADNVPDNCYGTSTYYNSGGYNIISDAGCFATARGDQVSTSPMLDSLADNGGPTETMAFQSGSPAIDAGNPSGCTDTGRIPARLTTDQRGYSRPVDGDSDGTARCDIGAFELQTPSLPTHTIPSS